MYIVDGYYNYSGKLGVIYLPEYVHTYDASDSSFVDPEEISSLSNFGYDTLANTKENF